MKITGLEPLVSIRNSNFYHRTARRSSEGSAHPAYQAFDCFGFRCSLLSRRRRS